MKKNYILISLIFVSQITIAQITDTQVMINANSYLDYNWNANSSNIWTSVSCGGKIVNTPQWVNIGNNTSIPYCWGGNSSLEEFDSYLVEGKSAGDDNTSIGYGAEPGCSVGVDCSGFVSRCYGLSSHYITTMLNTDSLFGHYDSYNDLNIGDFVNKPGLHTRLVTQINNNGTITVIESTTGNSTLSNVDRVITFTYPVSELINSGYNAQYYTNMTTTSFGSCNDYNEPNNIQSQATQLYEFGHDYSISDSYNECIDQTSADIDWYRINLASQGELTITLSSQEISYLYLDWLDNGNVTSSTTVNGDERIVICSNNGPACYDTALRIYTTTQNGNDPIPYTLDIQWSADQSCNNGTSGRQSSANNTSQNNSTITINGNTNVCEGLSNTLSISGSSGPFDWFVNGQSVYIGNTFNTQSLNTGQYDLFVIATNDVCSFAETQINISSGVTANAGSNQTIPSGGNVTLQGSGGTSCSWSPTTGLSNPNSCTTTASPSQTTTYTLTVTENGCTDTDTVTITVDGSGGGNPPANDDCSNATTLTSNTSCNYTSGTVEDATPSVGANNCLGCSCTSPDDYDVYYKFTAVETSHTVTVGNYVSNFDAVIELRTSCSSGSSNYISCYDPVGAPTSVSQTWNNLNIGQTYYIRVFEWDYQGSPPNADTFDICVTHQNSNSDGIDLVSNITSVSNDNPDVGDSIDVTFTVTNNGDENVSNEAYVVGLYLSTNQTYSSSDDVFPSSPEGLVSINAGQTLTFNKTITIPSVSDGQYYILANPDVGNNISESEEGNNISYHPIYIGQYVENGPDLDVRRVRAVPDTGLVPGQEVEIEIRIENEGNENANSFDVLVFLDLDDDGDYDSNEFMGEFAFSSLDAGEDDTVFVDFNLPTNIPSEGVYDLIAIADSSNDINEPNENNNDDDDRVTIALASSDADDVVVLNETVNPTNVNAGGMVNVIVNHVYLGNQTKDELPTLHLGYYLSSDCDLSIDDILLDDETSNIGIDDPSEEEDETLIIPTGTPTGNYYILFVADFENELDEGVFEGNNVECIEINVNNSNTPEGDIYITDQICTPHNVMVGNDVETFVNINYSGNQLDADLPSFTLSFYLSTDCVLSIDDMFLDDTNISLGSDYTVNDDIELNDLPANLSPGTYYIIFLADAENELYEVNENNNIACAEFQVFSGSSNYQDVTLTNPYVNVTEASVGDQVYISVFQNYTGYQIDGDMDSVQVDYYLSTDCILSSDDYFLEDDFSSIGSDDPSQFENQTVIIPNVNEGDYYILFIADATDIITENDENNNTECVPITITDGSLGIEENTLDRKIKIYPNPFSDSISLDLIGSYQDIRIELFNLIGQRIISLDYKNKELIKIDTSKLSSGIYILELNLNSNKTIKYKIIKE